MSSIRVPLYLKVLRFSCAVIYCILAGGPIFGFAALKPVLVAEGVYANVCKQKEAKNGRLGCVKQEEYLNFMFIAAAAAASVAYILVSTVLDRLGPRACGFLGSAILALGSWMLSNATTFEKIDGYWIGYMLLGLAGPFVFFSTLQLSNMFPRRSAFIIACLTGASDASSAIFLFYKSTYSQHTVSLSKFFRWYLLVPAFIFLTEALIMPHSHDYKTLGGIARVSEVQIDNLDDEAEESDEETEDRPLLGDRVHNQNNYNVFENTDLRTRGPRGTLNDVFKDPTESSGVWGALHDLAASKQLTSPWFLLIVTYSATHMVMINHYIATINTQYWYMLGSEQAKQVTSFFDIALPIGGILAIPLVSTIYDRFSTLNVVTGISGAAVLVGLLSFIPAHWASVLRSVILTLYRPILYTSISDYSAKVFGFDSFGIMYGLVISVAGMSNWFLVYLEYLTHRVFRNNPLPVNGILTALNATMGLLLVIFLYAKSKYIRRKQLGVEAARAEILQMPGADHEDCDEDYHD